MRKINPTLFTICFIHDLVKEIISNIESLSNGLIEMHILALLKEQDHKLVHARYG